MRLFEVAVERLTPEFGRSWLRPAVGVLPARRPHPVAPSGRTRREFTRLDSECFPLSFIIETCGPVPSGQRDVVGVEGGAGEGPFLFPEGTAS